MAGQEGEGDAPAQEASAVWLLAAGQTLGYACIFYLFAALVVAIAADTGWGKPLLALGPTLAILVAAALAPLAGRLVDGGYGPRLLVGGALFGAAALAGLSAVVTPAQYLAAWAALGVAQAACLYEVAFAWLVRRRGAAARAAIIRVTLVAGFASTLAFPAGTALAEWAGWRAAVLVAAVVMAAVAAPVHGLAAWRMRAGAPRAGRLAPADRGGVARALGQAAFWRLGGGFMLANLNHWMLIQLALPVMTATGATAGQAVAAAACVGPAQVAGRILLLRYEARLGTARVTALTAGALVAGALWLALAGLAPPLVFAFAVTQGAAMGVMTILRPTLQAATLGRDGFGAVAGALAIPPLLASAAAPALGALVLGSAGPAALTAAALAAAVGAAALLWSAAAGAARGA
ncbi:MAG: MFS transporter [Rhodobacteraceae bacterium]|jgi:hypothetical protein|nr:MFS transporter [Paracoccaceae bacterium]